MLLFKLELNPNQAALMELCVEPLSQLSRRRVAADARSFVSPQRDYDANLAAAVAKRASDDEALAKAASNKP